MERNHSIRIGELFYYSDSDEDGSCYNFYQVVGLSAKTIVELVSIPVEYFLDELCEKDTMRVGVQPRKLTESEWKSRKIMEGRGADCKAIPGLCEAYHSIYGRDFEDKCLYSCSPEKKFYETGYWGGCARSLWEKKKAKAQGGKEV